jgi:type II secretion system (T2SS) protein E
VASIVDLLVKIQLLDDRQHEAVLSRTGSIAGGQVVQEIAELGYATEGAMARGVSVELGLPRIDLAVTAPEPAALALLDARICAERFVLPVALRENGELLWVAMADPTDQEALQIVRRRTQKRVRPAVAGPSEILRAVRALYPAPEAGRSAPEPPQEEQLPAIEIAPGEDNSPFEVVNVAADIETSAISRIARQLGVAVPARMPSQVRSDVRGQKPPKPIPPPASATGRQPSPPTLDQLFAVGTGRGPIANDDLTAGDLPTLEALRSSLEKSALVLRSLAELCLEKRLFTREEIKSRYGRG